MAAHSSIVKVGVGVGPLHQRRMHHRIQRCIKASEEVEQKELKVDGLWIFELGGVCRFLACAVICRMVQDDQLQEA